MTFSFHRIKQSADVWRTVGWIVVLTEILREIGIWMPSTASTRIPNYRDLSNKCNLSPVIKSEGWKFQVWDNGSVILWRTKVCSIFLLFNLLILRPILSHGYSGFKHYIIIQLYSSQDERCSLPYCLYQGVYVSPDTPTHVSSYVSLVTCPLLN